MARRNRLVIPLSSDEREAIDRLARMERLYSATLARKLLLEEAERRGLVAEAQANRLLDVDTPAGVKKVMSNGDGPTGSPRINL